MAFDVSGTAGTVFGIAGMGIGIGILAHTARNVTRMTDDMYGRPRREAPRYGRRGTYRRTRQRKRMPTYKKPRLSYRPGKMRTISVKPMYNWKM